MNLRIATVLGLGPFLVLLSACHHWVEPIRPPALLVEEIDPLPGPIAIQIENGYSAPEVRPLVSSGIHELRLDLRDWTARVVSELHVELERRQAIVHVPPESLADTSAAPLPLSPESRVRPDATFKRVVLKMLAVEPPDPGQKKGPVLRLSLEGLGDAGGGEPFATEYTVGSDKLAFSEALLDLKRRIVRDPDLTAWLLGQKRPEAKVP